MSRVNVEVDPVYNLIQVTMPYDEDAKEALKQEFKARWDPDDKCWNINANNHTVAEVEKELKLHFPKEFR